jgi:hypothetical protein
VLPERSHRDPVVLREDPLAPWATGLAGRLDRLGFEVALVPDEAELRGQLARCEGPQAVLLNVGLGAHELGDSLATVADASHRQDLTVLAIGDEPSPPTREQLRRAGVTLSAFGSLDDPMLRFQVNRAFLAARHAGPARRERRAPLDWAVGVHFGTHHLTTRLYSLSRRGAFLEMVRPPTDGTELELDLPLPQGPARVGSQVVHSNPPGHRRWRRAPIGVGIRFEALRDETAARIDAVVTERCAAMLL